MKNSIILISALLIAGAIAGVGAMAIYTYKDVTAQEFLNQARYQCGQTYRYTITQKDGSTVSYPMEVEYEECLSDLDIK